MCCVHLAVLGAVGGGLASSAHEWLLQCLGAVVAQRGIAAVALGTMDLSSTRVGDHQGSARTVQSSLRREYRAQTGI